MKLYIDLSPFYIPFIPSLWFIWSILLSIVPVFQESLLINSIQFIENLKQDFLKILLLYRKLKWTRCTFNYQPYLKKKNTHIFIDNMRS